MLTGDELLAKVKELRPPEEKKETTITKEQLNNLWNALEHTQATIYPGANFQSQKHPEWIEIHKGRAHQSNAYLKQAIDIVNQLKKELQ
jgi:hypothetical protein